LDPWGDKSVASMQREPRASSDDASAAEIAALASHDEPEVRQAVAEAAVDLPAQAFEAVITRLLDDPEVFVKRAAQRSYKVRSLRQKAERTRDARSADVLRIRTRLKDVYGREALRDADQLCDRALRQIMDGLDHEVSKLAVALRAAIGEVRTAAEGGRFDRLHVTGRRTDQARGAGGAARGAWISRASEEKGRPSP
jgi:hypothetical protein